MAEWKEYTGSDEQVEEMCKSKPGYLLRFNNDCSQPHLNGNPCLLVRHQHITHYLINNPHPLADMICQQARTGLPVWVKESVTKCLCKEIVDGDIYQTTKPNWNIPGAQYSFTPFED